MIDLSAMRAVRIDASGRTVHVQGGATWADVDRVTAPARARRRTGGVVSETGVAGLALSGGVSHQRRRDGMTIDNLVSAEVVLADGRRVRASADEHPDLYWALRGGGGNFGVVTSFELRLHELGPEVFGAQRRLPARGGRARARRLARRRRRRAGRALDRRADLVAAGRRRAARGAARQCPTSASPACGRATRPRASAPPRPLRELATPLVDMSGPVDYLDFQSSLDPFFPAGRRYYWKALYLDGLSDAAIDTTVEWSDRRPSNDTLVIIRHCGGAISRVGAEETAFGDRSSEWMLSIDSTWREPADDEANIAYTREFWDAARCRSPTARPTSTSRACSRRATPRCARATAPTTPGWRASRPPTTRTTASGSTRTSAPRPRAALRPGRSDPGHAQRG